jgi:hypothetical protein
MIVQPLNRIDRHCLRFACRRTILYTTTAYPNSRLELRTRLRRDQLNRTIAFEAKLNTDSITRPFCSACCERHPRSRFTATEERKPTAERNASEHPVFSVYAHTAALHSTRCAKLQNTTASRKT